MTKKLSIPPVSPALLNSLGIGAIGLVKEPRASSYSKYLDWVNAGFAGALKYLTDDRKEKREDLKLVFPEFQSALVFLFPYAKTPLAHNGIKMADYLFAFDEDYHRVIPKRIHNFFSSLNISDSFYEITVDTAPILERDLAYRAGLGWIGKNSMLLNKHLGSYFLIASAIFKIDVVLQGNDFFSPDKDRELDHCGHCRACIDACPTTAILENQRQINTELCISSYTIELFHGDKNPPMSNRHTAEIYGCDLCQSVCPWNNKIAIKDLSQMKDSIIYQIFYINNIKTIIMNLLAMSKRSFRKIFFHTALARTGRDSVVKNLQDKLNVNNLSSEN